jgi:hypothetical protein
LHPLFQRDVRLLANGADIRDNKLAADPFRQGNRRCFDRRVVKKPLGSLFYFDVIEKAKAFQHDSKISHIEVPDPNLETAQTRKSSNG